MAKPQKKPKIIYKKNRKKEGEVRPAPPPRPMTPAEILKAKELPPHLAEALAKAKLREEKRAEKKRLREERRAKMLEERKRRLAAKRSRRRRKYQENVKARKKAAREAAEAAAAAEAAKNPAKKPAPPAKQKGPAKRFRRVVDHHWVWVPHTPKGRMGMRIKPVRKSTLNVRKLGSMLLGKWSHVALVLHYRLPLAIGEGDALIDHIDEMLHACNYIHGELPRDLLKRAVRWCLRDVRYLAMVAHPASRRFHLDLTDAGPVWVAHRRWARRELQSIMKNVKGAKGKIKGAPKSNKYIQLATAKRSGFASWEVREPYVWYHNEIEDRKYWRKRFLDMRIRRERARRALQARCEKILETALIEGVALDEIHLTEKALRSFPKEMRMQIEKAYRDLHERPNLRDLLTPKEYQELKAAGKLPDEPVKDPIEYMLQLLDGDPEPDPEEFLDEDLIDDSEDEDTTSEPDSA
ncbi:MAG: hypothetical protein JJ714_07520 [Acidithiobacillus sp.]|nr:hypothetical protein [Acidithiobacillus sp.]